jgi:hypothetical protein
MSQELRRFYLNGLLTDALTRYRLVDMGRWGLTDPELLAALDQDPELVRMFEQLAAEDGLTPAELLKQAMEREFKSELDQAFDDPPGSRRREVLAKFFEEAGGTAFNERDL